MYILRSLDLRNTPPQLFKMVKILLKSKKIAQDLADVHHRQGLLKGKMNALIFSLRDEKIWQILTLDATQKFDLELSDERFFNWYAALFPTERSGIYKKL